MSEVSKKLVKTVEGKNGNNFMVVKIPYKAITPKGTDVSNYTFIVVPEDVSYTSQTVILNLKPDKIYHLRKVKAKEGATPIDPITHKYNAEDLETIDAYIMGADLETTLVNSKKEFEEYRERCREEFLNSCVLV